MPIQLPTLYHHHHHHHGDVDEDDADDDHPGDANPAARPIRRDRTRRVRDSRALAKWGAANWHHHDDDREDDDDDDDDNDPFLIVNGDGDDGAVQ